MINITYFSYKFLCIIIKFIKYKKTLAKKVKKGYNIKGIFFKDVNKYLGVTIWKRKEIYKAEKAKKRKDRRFALILAFFS